MSYLRRGYLYALTAYVLWGVFPLYFKLLRPTTALEILAQRVVWSLLFIAIVLGAARRWRSLAALLRRPRTVGGIAVAATLLGVNWFVYIYGVNSDHIVETSLGYFINPMFTVLLGVLVMRERLRPAQWLALAISGLAVAVLTVDYGRLPWIALTLALSFGGYGLIKKRLGVPAGEGLFVESAVLVLPALGYLAVLGSRGDMTFGRLSVGHTVLLVVSGVLTAIPLLSFAEAANRIPLSALGMLQYLAPTLQLAVGVLIFHEPMPPVRLAGFALVWVALGVFTWDGVRAVRRTRAAATDALPEAPLASATPSTRS